MNIITAWEVVKYGPVLKDYPTAYVCNHIKRSESKLFRKCYLGIDFLNKLKADLIPREVEDYDTEKVYNLNDLVCYDGCIFQSLKNDNDVHPEDDEDSDPCWKLPDKFKSACYQDLWECHLRYWLSLEILTTSIRYSTYQAGAKGLTKVKDDPTGLVTVNPQEFSAYKKELKHDAADELELMFEYLVEKQNDGTCDFSSIKRVATECGCTEANCPPPRVARRRRFHFKTDK